MEDDRDKYTHKLTHFVTILNPNCSMDLIPKNVQTSGFLSIPYSKPFQEYRKHKIKNGNSSMFDLHFKKGYKTHFTQENFDIVAIAS